MTTKRKAEHVLVVEDEVLVALYLEDLLDELGYRVRGMATRVEKAMELARTAGIDLAILDINLGGATSFPVAAILRERNIPFFFVTGYGSDGLEADYREEIVLRKPIDQDELRRVLERLSP